MNQVGEHIVQGVIYRNETKGQQSEGPDISLSRKNAKRSDQTHQDEWQVDGDERDECDK